VSATVREAAGRDNQQPSPPATATGRFNDYVRDISLNPTIVLYSWFVPDRECAICGASFTPRRKVDKTCSLDCQVEHRRKLSREKARRHYKPRPLRPDGECEICKVSLPAPKSGRIPRWCRKCLADREVARGHARSGYAGGSWGPSEPVGLGLPLRARHFNRELAAVNRSNRTKIQSGKYANRNSHVPAAGATVFLDVFIHVTVIDRVPVDGAVGMNMGENMSMLTAFLMLSAVAVLSVIFMGMAMRHAVVIAAGASRRSL
jgi:predicted nucleic acid-binding Zn ribbon protein